MEVRSEAHFPHCPTLSSNLSFARFAALAAHCRDVSQFHDPCSSLVAAKFYMYKNPNHFNLFKVPSSTGDMKKVHVQETKIYKARESGSEEWTIVGR